MKQLLILLFVLSFFCCTAQNKSFDKPVILLSKNGVSKPVEIEIKAYKPIKIKTSNGKKLTLVDYSVIGDSVLASSTDTVALSDITRIKGKLKGSPFRKISGGLVAGTGYYFVMVGYVVGIVAFHPIALAIMVPSAGVAYAGHYISGARHFDTTEK
ncbi:hypothetical protein ACFS7Z_12930 [Pontibacter toksunensis]|uniref:Uncharacterized protein n=1 Tax=Pontibacter toksunensis TaxID=1332631 RepID=A0ABW6BWB6_9BACT